MYAYHTIGQSVDSFYPHIKLKEVVVEGAAISDCQDDM